jgi:hypothetical protein
MLDNFSINSSSLWIFTSTFLAVDKESWGIYPSTWIIPS